MAGFSIEIDLLITLLKILDPLTIYSPIRLVGLCQLLMFNFKQEPLSTTCC